MMYEGERFFEIVHQGVFYFEEHVDQLGIKLANVLQYTPVTLI